MKQGISDEALKQGPYIAIKEPDGSIEIRVASGITPGSSVFAPICLYSPFI